MPYSDAGKDGLVLDAVVSVRVARARLAIGLAQGLLLYALYRVAKDDLWPASAPYLFAPLLLLGLFVPVLLISSLGHLQWKKAAIWALAAGGVIAALAVYDIWRGSAGFEIWNGPGETKRFPSGLLIVFGTASLYIAHVLVTAGALERRWIARYPTYFEQAWKLAIQLLFSAFFAGALWLVLGLGAALFMLVKLDFLKELLQRAWFAIPVSCFAFSVAMHLTDVRPAIVRGIRTLLLVLMSWILPVATIMVAGFLLSLPFAGLEALWATRNATALLLGTAALLVKLINAAFQNGEAGAGVARTVRVAARAAASLLLPICAIAVYALGLRVREYGWTTDRIIAAACLLVAGCYAVGYAYAATRRGAWLQPVARVNVASAFVVLGVLLALFSPLADPARLSVNSQMARLAAGKTGAARFDFDYLRFEGARYGREALEQLKAGASGPDAALIREQARLALLRDRAAYHAPPRAVIDVAANLKVWPAQARLPQSFLRQDWSVFEPAWELPSCLRRPGHLCDAHVIDFDGDGRPEILLIASGNGNESRLLAETRDGHWIALGRLAYAAAKCLALREKLQAGQFRLSAPRIQDLEIAGQRIRIVSERDLDKIDCPASK